MEKGNLVIMYNFSELISSFVLDEEIKKRIDEYKTNKKIAVPFSDSLDEIRNKILTQSCN